MNGNQRMYVVAKVLQLIGGKSKRLPLRNLFKDDGEVFDDWKRRAPESAWGDGMASRKFDRTMYDLTWDDGELPLVKESYQLVNHRGVWMREHSYTLTDWGRANIKAAEAKEPYEEYTRMAERIAKNGMVNDE